MKPWTRDDTKEWIIQLEHRVEDIGYYLTKTVEWCEGNDLYSDQIVFACCLITVLWVSNMRGEPVSKQEALELIGVSDWYNADELYYELGDEYTDYDHYELLEVVARKFLT